MNDFRITEDGLLEEIIPQEDIILLRTREEALGELNSSIERLALKQAELDGALAEVTRLQEIVDRFDN